MKLKGRRKSSNMQDQRGPTAAYNRPSALKTASDNRKNQAFWEGKGATASGGKMAKEAGIDNIAKAVIRKKTPAPAPPKGRK